jgi:hypothetical protein
MSEVDVQQPEIVTDVDQNRKYIEDFIDQIQSDNFAKAETNFKDMVGDKLATALDQQKAKIAGAVFNSAEMEIDNEEESEEEDPEEVVLYDEDK